MEIDLTESIVVKLVQIVESECLIANLQLVSHTFVERVRHVYRVCSVSVWRAVCVLRPENFGWQL